MMIIYEKMGDIAILKKRSAIKDRDIKKIFLTESIVIGHYRWLAWPFAWLYRVR